MPRYEFLKGKSLEIKEFPDIVSAATYAHEIGASAFLRVQEEREGNHNAPV